MTSGEIVRSRWYFGSAVLVLCALSYLSVSASVPTLWSPYPGAQLLLITTGVPRPMNAFVIPLIFAVCTAGLVVREYRGTLAYLAWPAMLLTLLNVVYVMLRAEDGYVHQGFAYVIGMIVMNGLVLIAFWSGWVAFLRYRTSYNAVLLSFVLFAWLALLAFPYFGEGI